MKKIFYWALAIFALSTIGCDRSDESENLPTPPEAPTFDNSAAGQKARQIYENYGLNLRYTFDATEFAYEFSDMDEATYTTITEEEALAFLTAFERDVLALLPAEAVRNAMAQWFLCDELTNSYNKNVSRNSSNNTSVKTSTVTEIIPMKIKTQSVALGCLGASGSTVDQALLQQRWIEAIVQTMFNNTPYPTEFAQIATLDVSAVTENAYATNYEASRQFGWYCMDSDRGSSLLYEWGFIGEPNSGLMAIRSDNTGTTELQKYNSTSGSRWYNTGFTVEMDFATYTAALLTKSASDIEALCEKSALVAKKFALVKSYFETNFGFQFPNN